LNWDKITETRQGIQQYLEEWVYGVKDRQEYWQKLGKETHQRLSVKPRWSVPVNYGEY